MRRWGVTQACVLCGEINETRDHLFFATLTHSWSGPRWRKNCWARDWIRTGPELWIVWWGIDSTNMMQCSLSWLSKLQYTGYGESEMAGDISDLLTQFSVWLTQSELRFITVFLHWDETVMMMRVRNSCWDGRKSRKETLQLCFGFTKMFLFNHIEFIYWFTSSLLV